MAIDFADLALRVDYSQVDKGTKALEGLAAAGAKAEQSTNRVGVSSIAQTRNMGAWAAIQAEAAGHVGEHSIAIGRLERALASYVGHVVGAGSATEQLIAGLLKFSVGTLETVGVLAGLAAVVGLYELITSGARAAKKQMDDMTDSLVSQARASRAATVQGAADLQFIAEVNRQTVGKESGFGWRSAILSALGQRGTLAGGDAESEAGRRANVQTGVEQATKNYTDIWDKAEKERTQKLAEEARKREEILRKEQEGFLRYQRIYREAYGNFAEPQTSAQRAADNRERIAFENQPSRAATNALFAPGGPLGDLLNFKLPNVHLDDGLTDLQKRLVALLKPFDAVGEAAVSLAERLSRGRNSVAQGAQNWRPGNIKGGLEAGVTDAVGSALDQFSPANLAYGAVTMGINFMVSGLVNLATSLLDGGAAARAYRAEMKRMRDEYAAGIAQFQHDDFAAQLAQNAATADQLLKQAQDTFGTVAQLLRDRGKELNQANAQIAAAEAKNAEIIKRNQQYALEDLAVRNLRATGQGDAADLLAFREGQARELQKAIDENRDQTYINNLRLVENNELLSYLNGTLTDAVRNAPTGFYGSAAYIGQFATPRGYPTDSGVNPLSPINPTGGLKPPSKLTLVFQPGALVMDKNGVMNVVLEKIDQSASATSGAGTSRSDALDKMARG